MYTFFFKILSNQSLLLQLSSVLSCVQFFATPWTAVCRLPCPSPNPGACSNSCPLSQWCHPTISSSFIPFYSCLQSFPASGFFFNESVLCWCFSGNTNFFWNSLAFSMIQWIVGNLSSDSSAFSKSSLNIWKFSVYILFKNNLENFEHYFAIMWDECNCAVVWTFFGIAFLWDWNENWHFPVWWPLLSFPTLLTYWVQHFHSIIF